MPGASFESVEGDAFTGNVMIKLGPINLSRSLAALGQRKGPGRNQPLLVGRTEYDANRAERELWRHGSRSDACAP
jgi:hypothetical protein